MHCVLVIPGILVHDPRFVETLGEVDTPTLRQILSRARRDKMAWRSLDAWLLEQFEVQSDNHVPSAPYGALAEGLIPPSAEGQITTQTEGIPPWDAYWCHAAPVSLRADRDSLLLADDTHCKIQETEARALISSINTHFGEGLQMQMAAPQRWYARLAMLPKGEAVSLDEVAGRAITPGQGGMAWHALMNEIQMLLYEHPVNAARESRGEPPINGVWLWGAGKLGNVSTTIRSLTSNQPVARGLAVHAAVRTSLLPSGANEWLAAHSGAGVHMAICDELQRCLVGGDPTAWTDALARLEMKWILPLRDALSAGRIGMLTLKLAGGQKLLSVEAVRHDLKRFWRRSKPLSNWLALEDSEAV